MADKVTFTVEGKGKNLKKTAKEAKAVGDGAEHAGQGLDKASKSGDKFHKSQKGVAGVSSNSTKNFSKMRGAIGGGSSGLVGAYATLAANVFAATAAFTQLRQAAQMEIMVQGLEAVGAAAGRNLTYAAEQLREISGEALSAEASVRVMSLGISAGFRTDQMERLTTVARGASLALGRDMTDALDRLTRGTAKLEPEILDELGIMVRLDDAVLKYATSLGKSADDLTQYERRQAFLNETLEQGEKKFGQLAESIDVNPYDRLSASLNDLAKVFLSTINDVLIPTIDFLTENTKALTGVLVLFGTSIFRHILPAVTSFATGMGIAAKATLEENAARVKGLKTGKGYPEMYNNAAKEMKKNGLSQQQFTIGLKSLNQSLAQHKVQQAAMAQGSAVEIADYNKKTVAIARVSAAKKELIATYLAETISQNQKIASDGLELLAQGKLITGGKLVIASIMGQSAAYWAAAASGGVFAKSLAVIKIAMMGLWRIGSSVLTVLLGPWGIAFIAASAVIYAFWDEIMEIFGIGTEKITRDSDAAVKALEQIGAVGESFNSALAGAGGEMTADVMVAGFRALNGILQETQSHLKKLGETARKNHEERTAQLRDELAAQSKLADEIQADVDRMRAKDVVPWISVWMAESDLSDAKEILEKLEAQVASSQERMKKQLRADQVRIVETMIKNTEGTGEFAKFAENEVAQMKEVLTKFSAEGSKMTAEELHDALERIRTPLATVTAAFDNAQDSLSKFNLETNKLANKDTTMFDGAIDAAKSLKNLINDVATGGEALGLTPAKAEKLLAEIKKQTGAEGLGILDFDAFYKSIEQARDRLVESKSEIKKLQSEQKRLNDIQGKFPMTQQMSLKMSEKQEQIRKVEQKAIEDQILLQQKLAGTELARLKVARAKANTEDEIKVTQRALDIAQKEFGAREQELQTLLIAKKNEQVGEEEKILKSKVDQLETQEAMLKAVNAQAKAEIKILELNMQKQRSALELKNLQDPTRVRAIGGAITPQQEFVLAKKNRDLKIEIINKNTKMMVDEAKLAAKRVRLETDLQLLKLRVMLKQEDLDSEERDLITGIMNQTAGLAKLQTDAAYLRIQAAEKEGEIALLNLKVEEQRLGISAKRGVASAAGQGATTADRIASGGFALKDLARGTKAYEAGRIAAEQKVQNKVDAIRASQPYGGHYMNKADLDHEFTLAFGDTMDNMLDKWTETTTVMRDSMKEAFSSLDMGERFGLIANAMQPLIEGFRSLGPEGVAIANGMQQAQIGIGGVFNTLDVMKDDGGPIKGMTDSTDAFGKGMVSAAGATALAAGSLQSLFATQKMASDVAIARIDNEIAQEKKRDGMSAKSVARIKKMEADKEKLKKKAFEQDKKAKIAGAIMAGAMAIMQAWAMNPIIGGIMTPIIAAITAMQVGIISSMQYQGGGGSLGGGPSKVSIGSRSNKIDVAGSKSGGELAYMRGERGMGTSASDFSRRGAFVGAKYRAVGGAAYVVGEQGPEVIVPETPGRIIPNDELTAGGQPINATFNIQTIDATNMEETLVSQRGNIINMIREAANNQGETFLEGLDTMALGDNY